MTPSDVISVVRTIAHELGVDPDLAVAIALQESGCRWPLASTRYERGYEWVYRVDEFARINGISRDTEMREQMTSWGPMHLMGAVARELGHTGPLPLLFQPAVGIRYGIMKLKKLCETYEVEASIIAAYNAGNARKLPSGQYVNQRYVDEVSARLKALRGK